MATLAGGLVLFGHEDRVSCGRAALWVQIIRPSQRALLKFGGNLRDQEGQAQALVEEEGETERCEQEAGLGHDARGWRVEWAGREEGIEGGWWSLFGEGGEGFFVDGDERHVVGGGRGFCFGQGALALFLFLSLRVFEAGGQSFSIRGRNTTGVLGFIFDRGDFDL